MSDGPKSRDRMFLEFVNAALEGASRAGFFPDRFLRSCLRLRCCPESNAVCDWTPVDYAAEARPQPLDQRGKTNKNSTSEVGMAWVESLS